MAEFWEDAFTEKQEMWGFEPAHSAILAKDFLIEKGIRNLLIPGYGYGRNAHIFIEAGIEVVGIEISKTAIELAVKRYGPDVTIYHGTVADMPFDLKKYDAIFCYALIHLLDREEREKFISDCYHQLTEDGYMIFTTITKDAQIYGKGTQIGPDQFEMFGGVKMFFYDKERIKKEFGPFGLFDIIEVEESYPFYMIMCKKVK